MDVRAKQRLYYLACPLNLELRVGGFAPRHLSRWAFLDYSKRMNVESTKFVVEVSNYNKVKDK
jgi:hypothetical protein